MKLSFANKLISSYLFVAAVTLFITGAILYKDVPHLAIPILKAGVAAFIVTIPVAWITLRKVRQPLRDLLGSMGVQSQDELGGLARTYSDMAARIEEKVKDLSRERTQLGAILSSLIESIVAIDHEIGIGINFSKHLFNDIPLPLMRRINDSRTALMCNDCGLIRRIIVKHE